MDNYTEILSYLVNILISAKYKIVPDSITEDDKLPKSYDDYSFIMIPNGVYFSTTNNLAQLFITVNLFYKSKSFEGMNIRFQSFLSLLNQFRKDGAMILNNNFDKISNKSYEYKGVFQLRIGTLEVC